jgi:phosphoribosylformimino-5-aminoimidazole carboxamide ribotide isomerase
MGRGLNVEASRQLVRVSRPLGDSGQGLRVIASGGVASLEDVQRAHRAGLSGVIIGRALYDGGVCLEDALQVGRGRHAG